MENKFSSYIKKNQFGPRSIEKIKNDMQQAKYGQKSQENSVPIINEQSKSSDTIKKQIDNLNSLRNNKIWK